MRTYTITIADNVKIVTAADVDAMTPYILLEQEDWFEDEIAFVRTLVEPGSRAFDIGANHGVYSLAIAARLGGEGDGHVWAFEPTSGPLAMLRASIAANGFQDRVTVVDSALSDHAGTARMSVSSTQSEGNSLQPTDGESEEVRLDTLDAVWLAAGAPAIDFVKLDAEGEEENILKGAPRFLAETTPLIMFEVKTDLSHNAALPGAFLARGLELYKLAPGLGLLVPFDPAGGFEAFQLNLFACKPERAARLAERGLLLRREVPETPLSRPLPDALETLAARTFAGDLAAGWRAGSPLTPSAATAYACYLAASETDRPAAERHALLGRSLAAFEEALRVDDHPSARVSHLRVLRAAALRGPIVLALGPLLAIGAGPLAQALAERPFLPPLAAWDDAPIQGGLEAWGAAMLADTHAEFLHYSSYFKQESVLSLWEVRANPNCTRGMYRRLGLMFLRANRRPQFANADQGALQREGPGHRNAALWRVLLTQ